MRAAAEESWLVGAFFMPAPCTAIAANATRADGDSTRRCNRVHVPGKSDVDDRARRAHAPTTV
jgi:hypothetical protein